MRMSVSSIINLTFPDHVMKGMVLSEFAIKLCKRERIFSEY